MIGNKAEITRAKTLEQIRRIVVNPAFRIGALDAAGGLPLRHDDILQRVRMETPAAAWEQTDLLEMDVLLAQRRYEEGRLAVRMFGLRFKGWSDPRFPPKAVRDMAQAEACRRCAA